MSQTIAVAAGSTIISEGEVSDGFYILISGSIEIFRGEILVDEIDTAGTIFGEMSQLLKKPRSTSVIAKRDCELAHITMGIDQLVACHPTIAVKLILTLARRLDKTNQLLMDAQHGT